ncbi:hypothetical protein J1614_002735 [Plenodomus biglobosus]|nr:hypothetical protein J1614_002735 [Plenodomus biglobosus]
MKASLIIAGIFSLALGVSAQEAGSVLGRQDKAKCQGEKDKACDESCDCCFSSERACFSQYGYTAGQIFCPLHKICTTAYGIPRTKCNADCCSISTGLGRGCPGK